MSAAEELPILPREPGPNGAPPSGYAEFRQTCPVAQVRLPSGDSGWLVTTHEDVTAVYTDRRFGRVPPPGGARLYAGLDIVDYPNSLINMDGERHARLRRLAGGPFLPRRAKSWRPVSAQVTAELLDAMVTQGPPADLVRDFAYPYPLKVICRLLGVPERDGPDFRRWATLLMSVSGALAEEKAAGSAEFGEYLTALVAARRKRLADAAVFGESMRAEVRDAGGGGDSGDNEHAERAQQGGGDFSGGHDDNLDGGGHDDPDPDAVEGGFLDDLILAADEDGSVLTEDELVGTVRSLIVAGHETTAGVIVRGTLNLLMNPEQMARLRAEPALMVQAVEEIVRLDAPGHGALLRYADQDVPLPSGALIPEGHAVFAPASAANRDPARYPDPYRLDFDRDTDRSLGGHLGFGLGAHYCLGASLARIELHVAFAAILERFPDLRLAVPLNQITWTKNSRVRVPTLLPIAW